MSPYLFLLFLAKLFFVVVVVYFGCVVPALFVPFCELFVGVVLLF